MRLSDAQQERYARHLLLDGLGGEGQERLLRASVRVRGTGQTVRWAARYLAASGIGTLVLDDAAAATECRSLSPDVRVLTPRQFNGRSDLDLDPGRDSLASSSLHPAELGAAAALRAVRELGRP
jgi:hypothetical protein